MAGPNPTVTIVDLVVGSGDEVTDDKLITVTYTGTITGVPPGVDLPILGGLEPGETIEVPVNGSMLITGWNQGVLGTADPPSPPMRVGGLRRITIPPELAYGSGSNTGLQDIVPSGATLVFDVKVLAMKDLPS